MSKNHRRYSEDIKARVSFDDSGEMSDSHFLGH
ncbi:hypothetical protein L861_19790 [Litchfieldella anticariensis FP35 = DSM 16096]|uniref:Uncharacterized protein n=1 Tax=Litchfieldella anticariensis (strain DSM 16096 / CECT 5854 / CIP 108499 / LMG 22089 / FP35) TaxID=1121939 RepID=S2LB35_LITA3|nr:hypothetical protein L861_19790 [Halomonas anticariensis FP35 = DSM 16096]